MASLTIAYILWFFLGIFGVHHFYLRRDRQAFVWWSTLGGFFCVGWVRDLWRLPEYVKECNEDQNVDVSDRNDNSFTVRSRGKPKVGFAKFFGMMMMGIILGYLVQAACPKEVFNSPGIIGWLCRLVIPPFAVAIGVHLVANIGLVQASLKWPFIGAYVGSLWLFEDPNNIGMVSLLSSLATYFQGFSWKPVQKHCGLCKRLTILSLCGTAYLLLLGSALYYNANIITKDGESVPLREAVHHFFKSPAWTQTKESFRRLWNSLKAHGWRNVLNELLKDLDPQGEANAYKVLGLDDSATQEDIKAQYRKLVKEWHPDKHKDSEKEESHQRFMEIQQAYNTLSTLKARRAQKTSSFSETKHTEF